LNELRPVSVEEDWLNADAEFVFLGDFGHSDVSEEFIEWLGDEKF
jgi:hypothetical protein